MTTNRYNATEDLVRWRDQVPRFFEEPFAPFTRLVPFITHTFAVDILERGASFEITAALSGIDPKDVFVTTTKDTLTIKIMPPVATKPADGHFLRQERIVEEMVRIFSLPNEIMPDKVTCMYEQGSLIVTLPKAEFAKPQPIQIQIKEPLTTKQAEKISEKELVTTH